MADNKFHVLRKSLSSWSLSTISKPKISGRGGKKLSFKPKISFFSANKKNRAEKEDTSASSPSTKEPLIPVSNVDSKNAIQSPDKDDGQKGQPTIVITRDVPASTEANNQSKPSSQENTSEPLVTDGQIDQSINGILGVEECNFREDQKNKVEKHVSNDNLRFIDDNLKGENEGNIKAEAINLNISPDEYYSWFDAQAAPLNLKEEEVTNEEGEDDYANYMASEYFDADDSRNLTPSSGKSYEDIAIPTERVVMLGSSKARDWVKSFNDEASKRTEEGRVKSEEEVPQNLPRSRSEVQLSNVKESRATKKREIVLNTDNNKNNQSDKNLFQKLFSKEKKLNNEISNDIHQSNRKSDAEVVARKESIKKIFGIKGKLSLKAPIMDAKLSSYKKTDIYLASTPYALTNTLKSTGKRELISNDSLETNDSISENTSSTVKPNEETCIADKAVDDTEELLKEIENYLSDTDNVGTAKKQSFSEIKNDLSSKPDNSETNISICINHETDVSKLQNGIPEVQTKENKIQNSDSIINTQIKKPETLNNKPVVNTESKVESEINDVSNNEKGVKEIASSVLNEPNLGESEFPCITEPSSETPTETLSEIKKVEQSTTTDERRKINPAEYLSKTFKSIKQNIISSELKDKFKIKEKRKKKIKIGPFRTETKLRNCKNVGKFDNAIIEEPNRATNTFDETLDSVNSHEISEEFNENEMTVSESETSNAFKTIQENDNEDECDSSAIQIKNTSEQCSIISSLENEFHPNKLETESAEGNEIKNEIVDLNIEGPEIKGNKNKLQKENKSDFEIFSNKVKNENENSQERSISEARQNIENTDDHINTDSNRTENIENVENIEYKYANVIKAKTKNSGYETSLVEDNAKKENICPNKTNKYPSKLSYVDAECLEEQEDQVNRRENIPSVPVEEEKKKKNRVTIILNDEDAIFVQNLSQPDISQDNKDISLREKETESSVNFNTQQSEKIHLSDKEFPLYENGIFSTKDAMETSVNNCLEQTSANNEIKSVSTYPKPSPRTKKFKYGYSKLGNNKSLCIQNYSNLDTSFTTDEINPTNEDQKLPNFIIQEKVQANDIGMSKSEATNNSIGSDVIQVNMRDSGYGNSLMVDESSGIKEPIYWEIGDAPSAPKASPRKKKDKSSTQNLNNISNASRSSSNLPEWIQQRPPIPSPRTKKTSSSQSLARESIHSSSDLPDSNVFGSSFTNIDFCEPRKKGESKWLGEDFYSGKAASIAYGVTTQKQPEKSQLEPPPPTLPQRTKRSSMMSLPGSVSNEEAMALKRKEILKASLNATSELNKKRIRRRTAPEVPPKVISHLQKKSLTPMQELEENLRYFLEVVNSFHGEATHHLKPDVILGDVLFCVSSLMKREAAWQVSPASRGNIGRPSATVARPDVTSHLASAFHVSDHEVHELLAQVQKQRETANVHLLLTVVEASELRPKTVRGKTNPYVTVDIPGTNQGHRTHMKQETLYPVWKQEFKLKVKNLHEDVLKLDVWHDFDPSHEASAVKDLKGLSRLVKGTKAFATNHEAHLLGTVLVPLKDICEKGVNDCFPLTKTGSSSSSSSSPTKDESGVPPKADKPRGALRIEACVSAATGGLSANEARRGHDALLARLVFHHLKLVNNNTEADGVAVYAPWQGHLAPEACAALAQHAIVLGLTPAKQSLSWWIVGSRVSTADANWQLKQLQMVQKHLSAGAFDVTDTEELAVSFEAWIKLSVVKLRHLRKYFPPTSGVVAKHQFSSILAMLSHLESNKQLSSVLERKEIKDLRHQVKDAVTDYMKIWWIQLIENNLKGEMRPEAQIEKVIVITEEAHSFLEEIATFYSPTLLKEMNIPYFREMFLMVTKELNPCVRPPLMNLYNILDNVTENSKVDVGDGKKTSTYTMEDGTKLWQLYFNLGKINKLGSDFLPDVRKESGIYEYYKWFNKSVRRWVDLARNRALIMIEKAVDLDTFEPVDEYCDFSSSVIDVSGIFTDVKIWWCKLEWPDPENCMLLLAMMLEDVCSYGMKYADLLKQKVEGMFSVQSNSDQLSISKQICIGLNNIEKIRDELTKLPEFFGYQTVMDKVKRSLPNGNEVCERFHTSIQKITESSSENMEQKIFDFIEAIIKRMSATLRGAVTQSCDESSPLLIDLLDPALRLLHKKMNARNFKRFLQGMWDEIIKHFHATVKLNSEAYHKGNASYFNGIYIILEKCLEFFSPCDDVGLSREEAKTKEYCNLLENLECLRLSTESLISKYYEERYEEQEFSNYPSNGELFVRAYFTKAGKLTIEVLMAKNMQVNNESSGLISKRGQVGSHQQQIDSYVKVQLRPLDWFPNSGERKTKTVKKSDPAVFGDDDKFEFDLTKDANGVSKGFLLFTLKGSHLGWSNTFIGEAVIPLKNLVCVDSSEVHTVKNISLKLTHPRMESGYSSLSAIRYRTGDRAATGFLKKLHTRLPNTRLRGGGGGGAGGLSSDEERPRPKSPSLLHKIGL